jgi:glutathione S-transferase
MVGNTHPTHLRIFCCIVFLPHPSPPLGKGREQEQSIKCKIMTPERTIYIVNGSIPSWRVLMALYEKGLSFASKRLRVMRSEPETRTPEFLALNPRGQTPLLIEPDGTKINESLAILHYLELRYPEPSLLPPSENCQEYANAIAWIQEAETFACVYEPIEYLFIKKSSDLNDDEKVAIKKALVAVDFELNLWENRASKHTFIASESFTLADCSFYPTIGYMTHRGLSLDGFPNLSKYKLRIAERASARFARPEGWERSAKTNLFQLAAML